MSANSSKTVVPSKANPSRNVRTPEPSKCVPENRKSAFCSELVNLQLLNFVYNYLNRCGDINVRLGKDIVSIIADAGKLFMHRDLLQSLTATRWCPMDLPTSDRIGNFSIHKFQRMLVDTCEALTAMPDADPIKIGIVQMLLDGITKNKSLNREDLADVYGILGKDVAIPISKIIPLFYHMIDQMLIAPDENYQICKIFLTDKPKFVSPMTMTNKIKSCFVLKSDGNVATKRCIAFTPEPKPDVEKVEVIACGPNRCTIIPRKPPTPGTSPHSQLVNKTYRK